MANTKKYLAFKVNKDCTPIEGTDRILLGDNIHSVFSYLASEESVKYNGNGYTLRLPNGDFWVAYYQNKKEQENVES